MKKTNIWKPTLLIACTFTLLAIPGINCSSVKNNLPAGDNDGNNLPTDGRFNLGRVASPTAGYIDSIFINSSGDRIYFLHSPKAVNDFMNGTSNYPMAPFLPDHTVGAGLDWNSDLYYIEWNGNNWSKPVNLGSAIDSSKINSLGNECCLWLNEDETEIIFYRDNFDLGALGPRGNFRATRASQNDPWGTPVLLPGTYGSTDQSSTRYRHDIHKGKVTGDLYLWEKDPAATNAARILYGKKNGSGWDNAIDIAGSDSPKDETQVWVSADEKTMLFNRRGVDANTSLIRMTRASVTGVWSSPQEVTITSFGDPAGLKVWGEPTFPLNESYMLYIQFDTSKDPWKANLMFTPGTPSSGFGSPTPLN